ncbi:MAG: alanine dehydrogenase [Bacteroidota bacterium]
MSDTKKKIPIPESLINPSYQTQTEVLEVVKKRNKLTIGIPTETRLQENRVALVPASIAGLVAMGHHVLVETGAGLKTNYTDHRFSEAGAEVVYSKEQVFKSDILLKVAPPTLKEIDLMHPGQVLISPLQIPILDAAYIEKLLKKRVIALAMEYIKDEFNSFPIVRTMSEIAGVCAMMTAAELMNTTSGGKGALLGSVSGVPPAKVVILGAGVVAEVATRVALGLGAEVRIFDNNISKLMRIQGVIGRPLNTSSLNHYQLTKELLAADVAIGAMHSTSGRSPVIVSEDIVAEMKHGAVIVDISIDQGGCFATSEVTTHDKPTFTKHGVIHYCVPNIASKVARTASIAVSNIMTPLLLKAGDTGSIEDLLFKNLGLRHGVYTFKGSLTNEYLSKRFGFKFTDLDLLMTSSS